MTEEQCHCQSRPNLHSAEKQTEQTKKTNSTLIIKILSVSISITDLKKINHFSCKKANK